MSMNTDLVFTRDEIEEYTRFESKEAYWRNKKETYLTHLINTKVAEQITNE